MRGRKPSITGLLAAGILAGALAGPAVAQTNGQNSPSAATQDNGNGKDNRSLSDKLDRSNGVIRPRNNVDPDIHEPPPPTGDQGMVVPPPTDRSKTEGRGPVVQPK